MEMETNKYGQEVPVDRHDAYLNDNGAYYAFMERPIANLQTHIPEGVKWSAVILEPAVINGNEMTLTPAVTRQKTVAEFVGHHSLSNEGDRAVFGACAMEHSGLRFPKVTKEDLDDWIYYAGLAWPDEELILLTKVEYDALFSTESYKQTGD